MTVATGDLSNLDPVRVSVVIPTYNQCRYLPAAIDSVLDQDVSGIELVVVDDGSTDATPSVIARYGDRIVAIQQPNAGAAHALNRGIGVASGALVCWLSSDDRFLPGKIAAQVDAFEADPGLGLCCTGWNVVDTDGRLTREVPRLDWVHPDPFVAVFWRNPINGSTVMMRRDLFADIGWFDERLRADVDADMWLRVTRDHRVKVLDGAFVDYRVHGEALSANRSLMIASKQRVRLARVRDGSLVSRLRMSDPDRVAELLVAMGDEHAIGQLDDVARALWRSAWWSQPGSAAGRQGLRQWVASSRARRRLLRDLDDARRCMKRWRRRVWRLITRSERHRP